MKRIRAFLLLSFVLLVAWSMPALADKIDDSVVGLYKKQGYINEYFGFQVDLPDNYTLKPRGFISLVTEDLIESANKESTISSLKTLIGLSNAKVFSAETSYGDITITVESPGLQKDLWDKESVIAENLEQSLAESLKEDADTAGSTITDLQTKIDIYQNFVGGEHSTVLYKYKLDGTQRNGMIILMRSEDAKFLCAITVKSTAGVRMEQICGYFSEYTADSSGGTVDTSSASTDLGLVEAGVLHAAADVEYPPFVYVADNGSYTGIDVEISQAIAEKLGLELSVDPYNFDELFPAIQSGETDMLISGLNWTEERAQVVNFTTIYYTYKSEDYEDKCAFVLSKNNTALYEAVNSALNELISDGTVKEIVDRYMG